MDFDDLDDVEDGQYAPIEYMTPITRNFRFPSRDTIPERIAQSMPEDPARKVCLRVFAFIGAGDTYLNWAQNVIRAPTWLELVVHEWPSHGTRAEEAAPADLEALANDAFKGILPTLQQHQPGGRFAGAPFAFIGHSIGALLTTALSKRIKDDLGLQPAAVVILDRAPPHMPLFSEYGQERMKSDPEGFLSEYVGNMKLKGDGAQMWINDSKLSADAREVGFYTFNCDMLVLRAQKNEEIDKFKDASPESQQYHALRDKLMFSSPGSGMDFDFAQFEEWDKWCGHRLTIDDIDAAHLNIKDHAKAKELIWEFLSEVKAPEPSG